MKGAALIGLGMVSHTYAAALADLAGQVRLTGVFARDGAARAAWGLRHADLPGAGQAYDGLDAIAADPAVDFVIVTTPPNARAGIVATMAQAGKHILMEKPVERTLAAATALCEVAESAGVTLGIVLQHRARPAAQALAARAAAGDLGPLLAVEVSVPWWRAQAYYDAPGRGSYARDGGGVLISQAIHTLDLMLSLTGPVAEVTAMCATTGFHRMEAEDFVCAGLRFANGAVGSLFASTAAYPGRAEGIVLHYRDATAQLLSNRLVLHWQDGRIEEEGQEMATGAGADPMAFTPDWHRAVIADFAQAIAQGRPPLVPGRTALGVHRLIAAIEQSGRSKACVTLDH
ncbi:MAG: Gfo/Idh/MocA family oxidoreductase [Rhodobacterales bacterium]|nr:Gfo/Idh/MocA family oxidoreductase [Rhodobacterales bacterium]